MIPIDAYTAVIFNTTDLYDATRANQTYNYLYMGADITLTGGVTIPAAKTSLTIDGTYLGVRYRFTDMNSSFNSDTLNVWDTSTVSITLCNMDITGRNYYGVPYIREDLFVNNSGVTVTYDNVVYSGVQLTYNPEGLTVYSGCDITITGQEVGEVCRVDFTGESIIRHNSTSDAVFWFRGPTYAPRFRLTSGAHVTITSANYFMYSLYPAATPLYQNPVTYELLSGSTLLLTCNRGISLNNSHRAASLLVDANARFRYTQQTANGTNCSLYINGNVTVNAGAEVYMQINYAAAYPFFQFTATNNQLNLNNPRSFVLYSSSGAVLASAASITRNYSFHCSQLNCWPTATPLASGAGGFEDDNRPQWRKPDWSSFDISGTLTPTQTTVGGTSFTPEELENLPNLDDLDLHSVHVLSLGDLPISVSPPVDDGSAIIGWSSPNAAIRIEYEVSGVTYTINTVAGDDGHFETAETDPIPAGTSLIIRANTPFLISFITTVVIAVGDIHIVSVPDPIDFLIDPIIRTPLPILPRDNYGAEVVIEDNRAEEGAWELLLYVNEPLRSSQGDTITNGLIFVEGGLRQTLDSTPIVVYTGGLAPGITTISWGREEGVLLEVTEPIRAHSLYTTKLNWVLRLIT